MERIGMGPHLIVQPLPFSLPENVFCQELEVSEHPRERRLDCLLFLMFGLRIDYRPPLTWGSLSIPTPKSHFRGTLTEIRLLGIRCKDRLLP